MKLADIFSNYYTVRGELAEAIKGLSPQQLAWVPPQHTNSIGKLLTHIAETEYWWISIVARKEIPRDRVNWERFEQTRTLEAILLLLYEFRNVTDRFLQENDTDSWDTIFYEVPGQSEKVSLRWLTWHVVEHQARHRGQIFMLMRMQGLDVPNV